MCRWGLYFGILYNDTNLRVVATSVIYRPLPTLQARPILHVAAPGCEYARAGSAKSTGAMCWKVHALPPFVVEVVQSWLSNRARAESWRMREKWLFKKMEFNFTESQW